MGSGRDRTPLGVSLPYCHYGRPNVRDFSRPSYLQDNLDRGHTIHEIVSTSDREAGAKQRHVPRDGEVCLEHAVFLLQLYLRPQPHYAEAAQHNT